MPFRVKYKISNNVWLISWNFNYITTKQNTNTVKKRHRQIKTLSTRATIFIHIGVALIWLNGWTGHSKEVAISIFHYIRIWNPQTLSN